MLLVNILAFLKIIYNLKLNFKEDTKLKRRIQAIAKKGEDKMIKLKDTLVVSQQIEKHFKVIINDKEVCVSKYNRDNEFGIEADMEIFKGKELLSEEEQEEVIDFVNDLE